MHKSALALGAQRYTYQGREIGEMTHLAARDEMSGGVKAYLRIVMRPGREVGFHQHKGETEVFHILSGEGEINDNGTLVRVAAGDVIVTPLDGGHAFRNTGNEDFVFTALIMRGGGAEA